MTIFKYIPQTTNVYGSRRYKDIKYIVIHDTANKNKGATAQAHRNYNANNKRGASAHYYVDDKSVFQYVGDSKIAGHCGDGKNRNGINNYNSLSIELCVNVDGDYNKAFKNLIELTKELMKNFNIPLERVVRHYDASGKICPRSMSDNNWALWYKFKSELNKDKEDNKTKMTNKKSEFIETKDLNIIKTTSDNIYIQCIHGKTLRQVGAYGINGTFFDTKRPELPASCWSISMNNGTIIGPNAYTNHPNKKIKRGTLVIDSEYNVHYEKINNIDEIRGYTPALAVGGVGLVPEYDPRGEAVPLDIQRTTFHTAIASKGKEIYLIVSKVQCSLVQFKNIILKTVKPDYCINLDGGGSSQMYYKDNRGLHSSRKLNSIIGIKGV